MGTVNQVRKDVEGMLPIWGVVRDGMSGNKVKGAREKYLPIPNPEDSSKENADRYENYLARAVYYNVTRRTREGLVGQVFKQTPEQEYPEILRPTIDNIDGGGVSLVQQAQKALGYCIGFGRGGLLTDFPVRGGTTSQKEILNGDVKPIVKLYAPFDIINYKTVINEGKKVLTMVVLREWVEEEMSEFEVVVSQQFRELRLVGGSCIARVWRMLDNVLTPEDYSMSDYSGGALKAIPFSFFGAENNDVEIDYPPMYDIACLNIAHYRNSADYEEACFIAGQPTPYFAGLSQEWVEDVFKGVVNLGSRSAIPLPKGGTAGLLQATPNIMPKEAMELKERQMVALGARLAEQTTVQRTATEARQDEATEVSVLTTCAKNVSEAYTKHLKLAGGLVGSDQDINFQLNTDLEIGRMSVQERQRIVEEWQAEAITFEEMRFGLRRAGVAFLDDDVARNTIEEESMVAGVSVPEPIKDSNEQVE